MPRAPLRRRLQNRNGATPRTSTYEKIPSSSPAKAELAKKLANKPIGARQTDSDDSDRLVVKGNGRKGRFAPKQEIYASGAVGKGDKPGSHPTRAQRRKGLTDATRDILANGEQPERTEKTPATAKDGKGHLQSQENPPHVNGVINKAPTVGNDIAPLSTIISSAVKAPGSVTRPVQPTPTHENSILGTLKPRRRQPSILQNLDHDASSFDVEDVEEFLPDDKSTPLHQSKPQCPVSATSRPSPLLSSSSRKRKLTLHPLDPTETESVQKLLSSPVATAQRSRPPSEPSLPAVPVSALRESGRKHRESIRDEDDVMALPQSSSSPAPSSPKAKTPASTAKLRRQAAKAAPSVTTKELLEAAMPAKRRRKVRERAQKRGNFDIPTDSDPEQDPEEEDSNFLPSKKGGGARRNERLFKPINTRTKATAKSKASQAGKKSKSSTIHFTTISTSAPILAPSSTSKRKTKSPSQQRSTTNTSSNTDVAAAKDVQKRYGGSRRQGGGTSEVVGDKENQASQELHDDLPDAGEDPDISFEVEDAGETAPTSKSRWADIDAWDMDFEDVEVMTGSSSPTRR